MDEDLARYAMETAQTKGAEYVEVRLQLNKENQCFLKNGIPEPAVISDSHGLGLRVLCHGALSFAAINDLSKPNVRRLAEQAVKAAESSASMLKNPIRFSREKMETAKWSAEEKKKLSNVGPDDLFKLLHDLDSAIGKGKHGVSFVNKLLSASIMTEEKIYLNSDGADLRSRVPRFQFYSFVTASYTGKPQTFTIPPGYAQLGESGGWEIVQRLNLNEFVREEAERLAQAVKATENPPHDTVDIVLGSDVAGLVSHESSGHPEEADRVLGREAAQAGESYLKKGDVGYRIGSSEAYVSDDPTLPHSMGFYLYDDEGVKARKRRLIDGGVIRELLHNRSTAFEFKSKSNGSSRATLYDREPIVRMANTFVEPGDYTLEELLEPIKLGVYIKSFMEWNIDDKRLNQRYVGMESYVIKNGEIKAPVKSPILEITTPKFWSSVDARGKDLGFRAAHCGKGDPMQAIPVWTGGPSIRLKGVKVGRR